MPCYAMAANLPCLPGSSVPTSFVPPAHNQGVSSAFFQGRTLWKIFLLTTGSCFVIELLNPALRSSTLRWTFYCCFRLLNYKLLCFAVCHGWPEPTISHKFGSVVTDIITANISGCHSTCVLWCPSYVV